MKRYWSGMAVLLLVATSGAASAQIHITPSIGAYIPASDLKDLRTQAEETRLEREGTLGLGLNIEMGMLRGSIAYASGAKITDNGVSDRESLGDGSVLAAAADIVLRPLPRLLVQPYLLGGVGFKRLDYSYDDEGLGTNPLPEDKRELALHGGIGADLMLGSFGIMAEVTDFVSKDEEDKWGMHDAFLMVGLRLKLGGKN
jgi:hypothetical protein